MPKQKKIQSDNYEAQALLNDGIILALKGKIPHHCIQSIERSDLFLWVRKSVCGYLSGDGVAAYPIKVPGRRTQKIKSGWNGNEIETGITDINYEVTQWVMPVFTVYLGDPDYVCTRMDAQIGNNTLSAELKIPKDLYDSDKGRDSVRPASDFLFLAAMQASSYEYAKFKRIRKA